MKTIEQFISDYNSLIESGKNGMPKIEAMARLMHLVEVEYKEIRTQCLKYLEERAMVGMLANIIGPCGRPDCEACNQMFGEENVKTKVDKDSYSKEFVDSKVNGTKEDNVIKFPGNGTKH